MIYTIRLLFANNVHEEPLDLGVYQGVIFIVKATNLDDAITTIISKISSYVQFKNNPEAKVKKKDHIMVISDITYKIISVDTQ